MALGNVQIEISGVCNAKCPYCITGQKNRMGQKTGKFLNLDGFKSVIGKLEEKTLIDLSTVISLYNYGEPFLSPCFSEIIDFLEEKGYWYDISTNASILVDDDILHRMRHLIKMQFSVCGMSQDSYDKIHGFSKDRILRNISKMIKEIHLANENAECVLKLQMYKFNKNEYDGALKFSKDNCMTVIPLHAIYANLKQQINMISEYQNDNGYNNEDLILDYLDDLLIHGDRTSCVEHESLVIDENLNVALCCMITKEMPQYYWKSLNELDWKDIEERRSCEFCLKCIKSGISCSICDTPSFKGNILGDIERNLDDNKGKRLVLIGSDGLANSFYRFFGKRYKFERKSELNSIEPGCFYILATKQWWIMIDELERNSCEEYVDYIIYNTYIR